MKIVIERRRNIDTISGSKFAYENFKIPPQNPLGIIFNKLQENFVVFQFWTAEIFDSS